MNVSLDLETWSTAKNAVIVSIGAVKFYLDGGGDLGERFHVAIDPELTPTKLLDITPGTVKWWLDSERDEPRRRWLAMEKVDLATALEGFAMWYGADPSVPVWGNGSDFDNVILRTSYELLGLPCPWSFRSNRCYRTMKSLFKVKLPREEIAHDALNDAVWQARHLQKIFVHLGLTQ